MDIKERFIKANQGHIFRFFDELTQEQKDSFVSQIEQIDLAELDMLNKELVFGEVSAQKMDFNKLSPAGYEALPEDKTSDEDWLSAKQFGEENISKLAVFVVAGGQGTRLGFDAPKGLYKVSPVKQKSLFEVFAEKILSANIKYNVKIPWLIMTSHINDEATRAFFVENNYFGLDKADVIFFKQGLMPAVDKNGKIILEDKGKIAMTPDGHGGCFRAMLRSGALGILKERGITSISYFQVDNPMVNIIDPYFLGFHLKASSEMSSKMIAKAYPLEKVGHFCVYDDKPCVVEYSDLPNEFQEKTDSNGNLLFIAGSVAIHILDVSFVESCANSQSENKLPFHRADKKIPFIDEQANIVKPSEANGIKFEMFAFDALPMAKNSIIIEGKRSDEFSPVKNAQGLDSPLTCKNDQKKQFAQWLSAVGVDLEKDENGVPVFDIEISALFASNEEDFVAKWNALEVKPEVGNMFYLA